MNGQQRGVLSRNVRRVINDLVVTQAEFSKQRDANALHFLLHSRQRIDDTIKKFARYEAKK